MMLMMVTVCTWFSLFTVNQTSQNKIKRTGLDTDTASS